MIRKILFFPFVVTLVLVFNVHADVINRLDTAVFLIPESSPGYIPLPPGCVYKGRQDVVLVPYGKKFRMYKTVDHINVMLRQNGNIATYGGNIVESIGQALVGGWLTPGKIASWMMRVRGLYKRSLAG